MIITVLAGSTAERTDLRNDLAKFDGKRYRGHRGHRGLSHGKRSTGKSKDDEEKNDDEKGSSKDAKSKDDGNDDDETTPSGKKRKNTGMELSSARTSEMKKDLIKHKKTSTLSQLVQYHLAS